MLTVRVLHAALACGGALALACSPSSGRLERSVQVGEREIGTLRPGERHRSSLGVGEAHRYVLHLQAGEAVRIVIDQQGIDLVAELLEPVGDIVLAVDGPTLDRGPELICFVARAPGAHLLRLRPGSSKTTGAYTIQLTRRRPARQQDRRCAAAVEALGQVQRWRPGTPPLSAERFAAFRTVSALFREAGEDFHSAIALKEACGVLSSLGRPAAACFDQALALVRAVGDARQEVAILNLLGLARQRQGELLDARACFEAALETARREGERSGEASALNNLALLSRVRGEPYQAIDHLTAALGIWRQLGERDSEAASLLNLGSIYTELGRSEEALDLLHEALERRRKGRRPEQVAEALVAIGWTYYLAEDPPRAAACFRQAITLYQAGGRPLGEAAALDRLGSALRRMGKPAQSLGAYQRSLRISEQASDPRSAAHTRANLGWLLVDQGRLAEAGEQLGRAVEEFRQLGDRDGRAHGLVGLATASARQGELKTARRLLEEALELVEEERVSGRRRGYWIRPIALWNEYFERYVDLLVELHKSGGDRGALPLAFEVSDRSRGRNLYEMLVELRVDLSSTVDPRLRTEQERVQDRLNAAEERRSNLASGPAGESERLALDRSLSSLRRDYYRVQAAIRATDSRFAELSNPRPVPLAEVQLLLDRRTRLLSFVLGERRSFLFVVGPGSIEEHVLPRRSHLEAMAKLVYQGLAHSHQQRARRQVELSAGALSRSLLGSLRLPPEVQRLWIVAEGGLLYIPFAALPVPPGMQGGSGGSLLIDSYEVVHLPSASALVALRRRSDHRPRSGRCVAVLADPVFSLGDPRLQGKGNGPSPADIGSVERLPFTRREAELIAEHLPEESRLVAMDFAASRDLVLSGALAEYRILHFATHAVIDERHPELSGVLLSSFEASGRPRPGSLRLHEIYALHLPADLAVLAGCRTALGRRVRGDGLTGLTQGFLYAGASGLVVSLWDIADDATAALMKELYGQLFVAGRSPAASLREAQLRLRRQPRWQAPYFWAGLVLQGDGSQPAPCRAGLPTNPSSR